MTTTPDFIPAADADKLRRECKAILTVSADLVSSILSALPKDKLQSLDRLLACDHHGDDPEAREQMRQECIDTPPHLQADLLAHFTEQYGRAA